MSFDPLAQEKVSRSSTRYDIEADWILMSSCTFRCKYCFWEESALAAKISPPADVDQLCSFFDSSGLTWLLHLTGGEPFVYPNFIKLCQLLVRKHYISINTNADSRRVNVFADAVNPERVDFINCGAHIQQRQERNSAERFISNFLTLKSAGFDVFASCVMYPEVFKEFSEIWTWYMERGVPLIPKALQGQYSGGNYPAAYTSTERACFTEYSRRAAGAYSSQMARRSEPPTIDPLMDHKLFLDGLPDYRGQPCHAGMRFVRIRENGDIRRCGPADTIGNVVSGWFERRSGPSTCTEIECPYFCEKYHVET